METEFGKILSKYNIVSTQMYELSDVPLTTNGAVKNAIGLEGETPCV